MSVDINTMVSNTQAIDFSKAEQEKNCINRRCI